MRLRDLKDLHGEFVVKRRAINQLRAACRRFEDYATSSDNEMRIEERVQTIALGSFPAFESWSPGTSGNRFKVIHREPPP